MGTDLRPAEEGGALVLRLAGLPAQDKLDAIGAKKEDLYSGPPLWAFDPAAGKWAPLPTEKPWPRNAFGASLEFVPELGGSLWQYGAHTWLLKSTQGTWKLLCEQGAALPIETLVCYDSHRKLLIAHRGPVKGAPPRTSHMALNGQNPSGWELVLEQEGLPNGHDARSWMYYDAVGKAALLYERATHSIWSYDPDERRWTKLDPAGPKPPFGPKERILAYLDLTHNVFVVIGCDEVWCYRYRK